jgi:hypothetical protein
MSGSCVFCRCVLLTSVHPHPAGSGFSGLGAAHVVVRLDLEAIDALQLSLRLEDVKLSILSTPKMKLKYENIQLVANDTLQVRMTVDALQASAVCWSMTSMTVYDAVTGCCHVA